MRGDLVDAEISRFVIDALNRKNIDLALAVQEQVDVEFAEADAQRARRIEAMRYEADLARRRFFEVDPANRLVAASLEADWNDRLRELDEACREREERATARDTELSERQAERIRELAWDFEQVWNAAETGNADRKRLLGLLIEDATLTRDGSRVTIGLRMRGGRSLTLEPLQLPRPMAEIRKTPPETVAAVDRLLEDHGDHGTARELNAMGCRNWKGELYTDRGVGRIRRAYGLPGHLDRATGRLRDQGFGTAAEVAAQIGFNERVVRRLGRNGNGHAGGSGHYPDRRPATVLHVQSQLRRQNGAVGGVRIVRLKMPQRNETVAAAGRSGLRWRLEALTKKGASAEAPAPELGGRNEGKRSLEGDRIRRIRGRGRTVRGLGGGGRAVAVGPVRLVEELDAATGHEQDLGGEPVRVLAVLAEAAGLHLARDVDQPALLRVLLQHVDQPVLERHAAVPLGLVDPVAAAVAVDVALVGRHAHVGHAAPGGEMVDGDVGAETPDDFRAVESEAHGLLLEFWLMTMECERPGRLSSPPSPFTLPALHSNSGLTPDPVSEEMERCGLSWAAPYEGQRDGEITRSGGSTSQSQQGAS